jgi:hypothetical protein
MIIDAQSVRGSLGGRPSALTVSAASGAPIRACRRFRFLPRLLAR